MSTSSASSTKPRQPIWQDAPDGSDTFVVQVEHPLVGISLKDPSANVLTCPILNQTESDVRSKKKGWNIDFVGVQANTLCIPLGMVPEFVDTDRDASEEMEKDFGGVMAVGGPEVYNPYPRAPDSEISLGSHPPAITWRWQPRRTLVAGDVVCSLDAFNIGAVGMKKEMNSTWRKDSILSASDRGWKDPSRQIGYGKLIIRAPRPGAGKRMVNVISAFPLAIGPSLPHINLYKCFISILLTSSSNSLYHIGPGASSILISDGPFRWPRNFAVVTALIAFEILFDGAMAILKDVNVDASHGPTGVEESKTGEEEKESKDDDETPEDTNSQPPSPTPSSGPPTLTPGSIADRLLFNLGYFLSTVHRLHDAHRDLMLSSRQLVLQTMVSPMIPGPCSPDGIRPSPHSFMAAALLGEFTWDQIKLTVMIRLIASTVTPGLPSPHPLTFFEQNMLKIRKILAFKFLLQGRNYIVPPDQTFRDGFVAEVLRVESLTPSDVWAEFDLSPLGQGVAEDTEDATRLVDEIYSTYVPFTPSPPPEDLPKGARSIVGDACPVTDFTRHLVETHVRETRGDAHLSFEDSHVMRLLQRQIHKKGNRPWLPLSRSRPDHHTCGFCFNTYPSRRSLFTHLERMGHVDPKPRNRGWRTQHFHKDAADEHRCIVCSSTFPDDATLVAHYSMEDTPCFRGGGSVPLPSESTPPSDGPVASLQCIQCRTWGPGMVRSTSSIYYCGHWACETCRLSLSPSKCPSCDS